MDIRFLPTFLTVVEEGTFGAAAEALHLTQPAVSYRMARLEEEMGASLFERAGRRMILTSAGRRLHAFCDRYLTELEELRAVIADRPVPPGEPIRISSVSGFGRYVLFPVLAGPEFRELTLELLYHTADEVFERVERGEADLGMVYRPKVSSYLEMREVCREELVLVAPAGGLLAGAPRGPGELERVPFVTYVESGYVFGAWFEHHFGRQPARLHSVHHYEELEEVVAMVALGRGLSIVPLDSAGDALDDGRIRIVHPDPGSPCLNAVHGVTRTGAFLRGEVESILAALEREGARRSRP